MAVEKIRNKRPNYLCGNLTKACIDGNLILFMAYFKKCFYVYKKMLRKITSKNMQNVHFRLMQLPENLSKQLIPRSEDISIT